ncbi:MAG: SH3 domain-containing protein, partial [Anaerolineales bacterium]|nr:SH3 domain-containing protein [Anaerolineales bacterium]
NKKRNLISIIVICVIIISCNLPSGVQAPPAEIAPTTMPNTEAALQYSTVPTDTPTATETTTPSPTDTPTPTATTCEPNVIAPTPVNVRSGPGTVYEIIGALVAGGSAKIAGKNSEGTWWYIEFPGGHGWVGGTVVTASCVPATLAIIAAPPTPVPPSGTCKGDYVYRSIRASDKICISPASKAQADADNAAATSRTIVGNYGASACTQGFVWREAYVGDVVCVTVATRSQAQADNAAAPTRVDPLGPYGPNSCIAGFVWREAIPSDVVCVTAAVRSQTAADNAAAASRIASADECVSGYVWRQAFPGDRVCVTPAIKGQVAADNADAPNHTW